jgi:hypothetical protein
VNTDVPEAVMRTMSVFCDETGTHDNDYFAWGSLWCPSEKVDEMEADISRIWNRREEIGWKFIKSRHVGPLKNLTSWFFARPWLCFQAFFVEKSSMRILAKGESKDIAYRKLLCTLLATQMPRFDALPGGPRQFEVKVDEVGSTTLERMRKDLRIIGMASRNRSQRNHELLSGFERVDSRSTRGIQLADLFVGAIRSGWENRKGKRSPKARYKRFLAKQLGWKNLRGFTAPNLKFNVWLHCDSEPPSKWFRLRHVRLKNHNGNTDAHFRRVGWRRR